MKREIRILGISKPGSPGKQITIIGTIFRGSKWLDGIINCTINSRYDDGTTLLARTIMKCKQYSQIHAIIFTSEWLSNWAPSDFVTLSRKTRLPVIVIADSTSTKNPTKPRRTILRTPLMIDFYRSNRQQRPFCIFTTKLSSAETHEILSIACPEGSTLPEAVRVANLISRRLASPRHIKSTQRTDKPL